MKDKQPDTFRILHLSDLHISKDNNPANSSIFNALLKQIEKDINNGISPEIVVISGDIANRGTANEYSIVKEFLDRLLDMLGLLNENIFMVPGNHDVDRTKFRPSEPNPVYLNIDELNKELGNDKYRLDLLKGLDDYFGFVSQNYKHLTSKNGTLIPFVKFIGAKCGRKIGLVGLNSAWMCRKFPDERQIAIGEHQIMKAMDELEAYGETDIRIGICHHPLSWLWPEDRKRCKLYLNDFILLSGHLHDTECSFVNDLDSVRYTFQSGRINTLHEQPSPQQYHYITVDWRSDKISLDFREFREGKWCLAGSLGDEGKKDFALCGNHVQMEPAKLKEEREQDKIFARYFGAVHNEHCQLPTQGFETNFRHPIEIEQVYINMRANIHGYFGTNESDGGERPEKMIVEDQDCPFDIKRAFKFMEKSRIKNMVILGDPGSGKTTLLKYILIMLVDGHGNEKLGIADAVVPFFASLRDYGDGNNGDLIAFLMRDCHLSRHSITEDKLEQVLRNGKGIILLDGLDEVSETGKRTEMCRLIEKWSKTYNNSRFVVTSRFAGYMGESRLNVNLLELAIEDFTHEDVKTFLIKWFESVEVATHSGMDEGEWRLKGKENALKLYDDISGIKHILDMAKNPLILQIIALVHRDRGRLPQRRVELYDECTNVLLEKWDMAKGLDASLLTAREARAVLQPLALWFHEVEGRRTVSVENILPMVRESLEELGKSDIDPKVLLENIRDRSGIFMGYSNSEYGFAHLSFQEYLCAEEIRNQGIVRKLAVNYSKRWWREVIRLCMALDNPSVIEKFMELIVSSADFEDSIDLVTDSINDSIKKPVKPFISAAGNLNLPSKSRRNAIRVLIDIGGDKVNAELQKLLNSEYKEIARSAKDALTNRSTLVGSMPPFTINGSMSSNAMAKQEQITNEKDNSLMMLIPGGDFIYGSKEDDKVARSDEKPQRVINLDDFYMDIYPVTNEQYCKFLNSVKADKNQVNECIHLKGSYKKEKCRVKKTKNGYMVEKGFERHPVIYVRWRGADAYAKWAGKRLPTEQEWEKAARGTEGSIYPWGDKFRGDLCNSNESGIGSTTPVNKYSDGKSFFGCCDMSGNVWEWTSSFFKEGEKWHTKRGGSWFLSQNDCRCAPRFIFWIVYSFGAGFRCART